MVATFIAVNQTGSNIDLVQLALTVPASGQVTLSDFNTTFEIQADRQLKALVTAGSILINDGSTTLDLATSLQYLSGVAAKANLENVPSNADATNWTNVAAALGGHAGINDGYIFKSNGAGSGDMVRNIQSIANRFTVGKSGDVDFYTIKDAVDAAIAAGVDPYNPYAIMVYPGNYTEQPMTIPGGLYIATDVDQRGDTVNVYAANPDEDLITSTGACIVGLSFSGVTNVNKCLFRASGGLHILNSVKMLQCHNGVILSDGALGVLTNFACNLGAPGVGVTGSLVTATDAGTYLAVSGGFFFVPPALLPYYVTNPIQNVFHITNNARCALANISMVIPPIDATATGILCEGGSVSTIVALDATAMFCAIQIGSSGSNTTITCQSSTFDQCVYNFQILSATGSLYTISSTDTKKYYLVPGATLTGVIQERTEKSTLLNGSIKYDYATDSQIDLGESLRVPISTAIMEGGALSVVSGLQINVASGTGFIARDSFHDDVWNVSWDAANITLAANSTNYVIYDGYLSALTYTLVAPTETQILLGTVITGASTIRFLHKTENYLESLPQKVFDYLYDTRRTVLKSGLLLSQGASATKISVASGSYYLRLNPITFAGATNATFSYFYGTDGYTEIASQTDLNTTQYDSGGVLTSMTAGYFRVDTAVLTSDGRISLIMGTSEYSSSALSKVAAVGTIPTFLSESACTLAQIIVQQGVGIDSLIDRRPINGAGSVSGVTVHAALAGLDADDHLQYLLVNGTRAMTGNLNMNSNNITNVGTINSINIAAHGSRHNPDGYDAIATGTPTDLNFGDGSTEGTAQSVARSDHKHKVTAGAAVNISTSNTSGSASSFSRSDHQHNLPFSTVQTVLGGATGAISFNSQNLTNVGSINGQYDYGPLSTNPVSPVPSDGYKYYNTVLGAELFYDGVRAKWLSAGIPPVYAGANSTTAAGSFFRGIDGIAFGTNRGIPVPKGTLVAMLVAMTTSVTSDIEVLLDNTVIHTFNVSTAGLTASTTINVDFNQGLMKFRNKSTGATLSNVEITAMFKRRA